MKALSVKQPWANWIIGGTKAIETRTWKTGFRGQLLICASKSIDALAARSDVEYHLGPRGAAIGIVDLVDCRLMTKADEPAAMCPVTPGRYAWVLRNARPIKPFAVKGALGLYEVPWPQ